MISRKVAIKVNRHTLRLKGYTIGLVDSDTHLTVGIRLVRVIEQLETIMAYLIWIDEAVIEVVAEE